MTRLRLIVRALALAVLAASSDIAAQPSITDTRPLGQPALNATHVAFIHARDLWVARLDGAHVRRLTTADGAELNPVFSPDGKTIAFRIVRTPGMRSRS